MKIWILAVAAPCWLAAAPPAPAPDVLRKPGENTVFSFVTNGGRTVSLCEGPKSAYLVYRFGTATKTELQYPAVLDGSSWKKFTYWAYHRGGGVANAGEELQQLSFKNGAVEYLLFDETHAFLNRAKEEDYRHGVGVLVTVNGKEIRIAGTAHAINGSLYLTDEQKERVTLSDSL